MSRPKGVQLDYSCLKRIEVNWMALSTRWMVPDGATKGIKWGGDGFGHCCQQTRHCYLAVFFYIGHLHDHGHAAGTAQNGHTRGRRETTKKGKASNMARSVEFAAAVALRQSSEQS